MWSVSCQNRSSVPSTSGEGPALPPALETPDERSIVSVNIDELIDNLIKDLPAAKNKEAERILERIADLEQLKKDRAA